jgi:hypothetical protein
MILKFTKPPSISFKPHFICEAPRKGNYLFQIASLGPHLKRRGLGKRTGQIISIHKLTSIPHASRGCCPNPFPFDTCMALAYTAVTLESIQTKKDAAITKEGHWIFPYLPAFLSYFFSPSFTIALGHSSLRRF